MIPQLSEAFMTQDHGTGRLLNARPGAAGPRSWWIITEPGALMNARLKDCNASWMSHSCLEPKMSVRKHKHDVHTLTMCRALWIKHWGFFIWHRLLNMWSEYEFCLHLQFLSECFHPGCCLEYFLNKQQTSGLQKRTAYFLCCKYIVILLSKEKFQHFLEPYLLACWDFYHSLICMVKMKLQSGDGYLIRA